MTTPTSTTHTPPTPTSSSVPIPSEVAATLPSTFVHGFATASHQIEGSLAADGRLPSVWDDIAKIPGKIADGSAGDTAIDSYRLYAEDVRCLQEYGANAYRLSISWSRIIPKGGRDDPINEAGIAYYDRVIDLLLSSGIQPYITIFHWDLPSALETKYGGWTCFDEITKDYERYARVLFERFGDRVKNWITLNEPICVCMFSAMGLRPDWNSKTDPWLVGHSLIYAHALAVNLYRTDFKSTQGGRIGVTLNCDWAEPIDESEKARKAAQRRLDSAFGWWADPIYLGHYPQSLVEECGDLLPKFTEEQWKLIKGSSDFFGLNSYSTVWVTGERLGDGPGESVEAFMGGNLVSTQQKPDGTMIGNQGQCAWLCDVPWGFRNLLQYIHKTYTSHTGLSIIVTEQGFCMKNENEMPIEEACNDLQRIDYYKGYLGEVSKAIKEDGIDISGYFAWSLADNWEWLEGYIPRFGVTYIDRRNPGYKRYPKESAYFIKGWFDKAIAK